MVELAAPAVPQKKYVIGSLSYSLAQLILVGAMLMLAKQAMMTLCGHLVLTNVSPLMLRQYGATPELIALITGTIPTIMSVFTTPILSTISDRTRTKMGRRMPYLIWSAPFLALTVALMGFTTDIAGVMSKVFPSLQWNWPLVCFGVLYFLFQCAYTFPSTVLYYLEPDVIPQICYGRYSACIGIAGGLLGACFNWCLLGHTINHLRYSLTIIGLVYLGLYILLYFFVKEGTYPPVTDSVDSKKPLVKQAGEYLSMFFKQCFSHRIYVALAVCVGLNAASTICRAMFNVLFVTEELHIEIATLGKITAMGSIIAAAMIYFFGMLMDKTHPMLIYFIGGILVMVGNVFGYFFIHGEKTYMVLAIIINLMYAMQSLAFVPFLAKIFPMDKFGQFASANGLVRDFILMGASALGGYFTGLFGYRVMFIWDFIVTGFATLALIVVYIDWKKLGGKNYVPPEPASTK